MQHALKTSVPLMLVSLLAAAASVEGGATGFIYWAELNTGDIRRADLNGANVTDLITGESFPVGVAVGGGHDKIYWTNATEVRRADLGGTNIETIVMGSGVPNGIDLHLAGEKVFWVVNHTGIPGDPDLLRSADLDGTGAQTLHSTNPPATAVGCDVAGGRVYFTDRSRSDLRSSALDGSDVQVLATGRNVYMVAADGCGERVYWTEPDDGKIVSVALDGSDLQEVLTGLSAPTGIDIDPVAGKIYWADQDDDVIRRADLDGSDVEVVVTTGVDVPRELAVLTPACNGDVNNSGVVDFDDLNLVLSNWGQSVARCQAGDATADGQIDFDDLNVVLSNWGLACAVL